MKPFFLRFSAVFVFISASIALYGQWSLTDGPYPGFIRDIKAFAGGYVAASNQGMYRSSDGGQTWNYYLPPGMEAEGIDEMEVAGNKVAVLTQSLQLFYSSDGGFTFQKIPVDLPPPVIIYEICLFDEFIYIVTPIVLYRSNNLGASWQTVSGQIRKLKREGGKLYEATLYTLRVSSDEGFTWSTLLTTGKYIGDYFVNGDTLLLAERSSYNIHRSVDGGQSWQLITSPSYLYNFIHFSRFQQRYLLDGGYFVMASETNGVSWNAPAGDYLNQTTTRCLFSDNEILLRGTDYGIFRSVDGGIGFHPAHAGLRVGFAYTLRSIDGVLYAATQKGLYRRTPDGEHWQNWQIGNVDSLFEFNDIIYSNGRLITGHVYSDDNGATWTSNTSLFSGKQFAKAGDRLIAYANSSYDISDNNGQTWQNGEPFFYADGGGDYAMAFNYIDGVFWGIGSSKQLMRSSDGGKDWEPVGDTLPFSWPDYPSFIHIAQADGVIILDAWSDSTGHRLWRSTDDGTTWSSTPYPFGNGFLAYSLLYDSIWMFAASWGGVFLSLDKGETWNAFNGGLRSNDATFLAVHGNDLWLSGPAGTYKRGLADLIVHTYHPSSTAPLKIYPNPASTHIRIETNGETGQLTLYDQQGRAVFTRHGFSNESDIEIRNLSIGIYRVVFQQGIVMREGKLIVVR